MKYLLTFLEGLISFITPCVLPLIPVYVSYFSAGNSEGRTGRTLKNSLGFVTGFTLIFVIMGVFAGTVGSFLNTHTTAFNIITGLIVVLLALGFLGLYNLPFFKGLSAKERKTGFLPSFLFGTVFSVSLSPCIGAFLGTALMQASGEGNTLNGAIMLVFYSLGLGIPFILSALLLDKLKNAFDFLKKHMRKIEIISGSFLLIIGILMMTGYFGSFIALLR